MPAGSFSPKLALSLVALAVYASLHPFSGWHDSGADPFDFLWAPWPRYVTAFDLATNVAAYVPLGFFLLAALRRRLPTASALLLAVLLGSGLSLVLEVAQNYLPSRVASNVDLACNAGGALAGALAGLRWAPLLERGRRLDQWRSAWLHAGPGAEAGLLLVGAWLLTQLTPETLSFGSGNLRGLLGLPSPQPFSAGGFIEMEAVIAGGGVLAAGLTVSLLARRHPVRLAFAVLLAGLLAKVLAFSLLMGPAAALHWVTPGAAGGAAGGLILLAVGARLVAPLRRALAALLLLLATALVNLAPDNPYLVNTLQVWNPGHFLNFNGLARLLASLWPFLALPWLMLARPERT